MEANRHNAVTAHYYLLMKQKRLEGDISKPDILTIGHHPRINKSVLGNRTTKNGQHLRKIAEGLGELNYSRFNQDTERKMQNS